MGNKIMTVYGPSEYGKRDSVHDHLLEATSEAATAPESRQKPLYTRSPLEDSRLFGPAPGKS